MVRWQPGARERLAAAAMALFAEQGFEGTTVADIAARAELTERTFFRHFADKREVLFGGQADFERIFTESVRDAPDGTPPFEIARQAMARADAFFDDVKRPYSRARQTVLDAEPSLQERELLKMATLKRAMTAALLEREVRDPAAALVAETSIGVFLLAFTRWVAEGETRSLSAIADALLHELRHLLGSA